MTNRLTRSERRWPIPLKEASVDLYTFSPSSDLAPKYLSICPLLAPSRYVHDNLRILLLAFAYLYILLSNWKDCTT